MKGIRLKTLLAIFFYLPNAASQASTSVYLGTLGQASAWLITGAGAVNAPSFATNLNRTGGITLSSSGSASGTFVQGASASAFTGYWHADRRFFVPANAYSTSLAFDSLYGNDRVVLRLNSDDVGNANYNAIIGVGVMGLSENTPDVPYNFTQRTSGTRTSGFVVGGWNTLRMIVNNNGYYPTHATPTAPFQFIEDVTNASVNAVLTYSVLPAVVVFNVSSGTQTQEANGFLTLDSSALSVFKSGPGTLVLSGSNSYTGETVIAGGTLALGNASSLGKDGGISFTGGALLFTSSNSVDYSPRFSTAANQAYKVDTNGRSITFASALVSNGGSLTKLGLGLLTLTGSNSYSGGTTISGGTLSIGNGGTTGGITGNITNNGTLVFNRSDASILTGTLSGYGVISKRGTGNLRLSGANTLTGSTSIQQGTLQLAHAAALSASTISVLAGGTLALTPGLVTTVGGLKPSTGGVIDVGNGLLTVTDGLSVLNLYSSLSVGRGSGAWDGVSGIKSSTAAASNGSRTVGWLDNGDGSVTFGYAASGDTNLDWTIDILDVANFIGSGKFNKGITATWAEGDFNYDGFADILDMADFMSSGLFNAGSYNATVGTITAVPEPSVTRLVGAALGIAAAITAVNQVRRVAGTAAARSLAGMLTSCP